MRNTHGMNFAAASWLVAAIGLGCGGAASTVEEQSTVSREARATLGTMKSESPGLGVILDRAHGFVVFPSVGKGGFFVGGASGDGAVYERGQLVGYAELNQASIGLQLGAQTFSEIIIFERPRDLEQLKSGRFSLGAGVSAVVLTSGGGAAVEFQNGVAVVIRTRGGLMIDLSVSGQRISFEPLGARR